MPLDALAEMAAAVQRLVAWSAIYIESAVGFWGVIGLLPGSDMGGGTLLETWEREQVEDLRAGLAAVR